MSFLRKIGDVRQQVFSDIPHTYQATMQTHMSGLTVELFRKPSDDLQDSCRKSRGNDLQRNACKDRGRSTEEAADPARRLVGVVEGKGVLVAKPPAQGVPGRFLHGEGSTTVYEIAFSCHRCF